MIVRYWFQCPGESCGATYVSVEGKAPKSVPCAWCAKGRAVDGSPAPTTGVVNLRPEIPGHFNPSIAGGIYVRNRAHLEHLQAKHGLSDFSPGGHGDHDRRENLTPSTDWK